jgi:hypothetical protein
MYFPARKIVAGSPSLMVYAGLFHIQRCVQVAVRFGGVPPRLWIAGDLHLLMETAL